MVKMKRQIRRKVFETNSSSVHTLTICSKKEYEAWKRGELLYDRYSEELVSPVGLTDDQKKDAAEEYESTKDDFKKDWGELNSSAKEQWYKKYAIDHDIMDEDLQTYDDYENDYELESYSEQYTTESGDNIVVFGRYGRDG